MVRPRLEYMVWVPHLTKYVNMVDKVQIRVTKLGDGFSNVEYSDRLRRPNLPTLMIELYKHFHAYDEETLSKSPRDRLSRKHAFQLITNSLIESEESKRTHFIIGILTNGTIFR